MHKYPLNLCPKFQRHTYTILRSYYPPELILYVIFYLFLAYVALVRKKKVNHHWAHKIVPRKLKRGKKLLIK